ncbi:MAG: DUF1259 domain-containing protein [Gemmatimonadetes bacterium]|nr:DUF1259 domain-containing protein [Gemmatimonadota bacterium]
MTISLPVLSARRSSSRQRLTRPWRLVLLALPLLLAPRGGSAQGAAATWGEVARILQTPAVATGGYQRFNFPRRDVTMRMGDVTVSPMLALGGWAGFSGEPSDAMLMGDLVVTRDELQPVLAELARQEIGVTSIHNHLAGESPSITYIHFHGEGDAVTLARRLDRAVALTKAPRPVTNSAPPQSRSTRRWCTARWGSPGARRGRCRSLPSSWSPGR